MPNLVKSSESKADLFEKVIINNDLAGLTPVEKVQHIKNVCDSLGLNPLTKPFQLIKFQGKEVMYATKDATEQLRMKHEVSIERIDVKIQDGIYIVTANAVMPSGRRDSSTGVIGIKALQGEVLANAMMKAETKAKRRVTLSICGLGCLDESELDTMKQHVKIDVHKQAEDHQKKISPPQKITLSLEELSKITAEIIEKIDYAATTDELKEILQQVNKYSFKEHPVLLDQIKEAKDDRKAKLLSPEDGGSEPVAEEDREVNPETGEVVNG